MTQTTEKQRRLEELAETRKRDPWPSNHLHSPSERKYYTFGYFHDGKFDTHKFVVPWTIAAYNVDAAVMIMGQDWASSDLLEEDSCSLVTVLGQMPCLDTNMNLKALLKGHLNIEFADTYATDLFVFVKPGRMSVNIPERDLEYCATRYALPQIEIIQPRIVVCLGSRTYNALRRVLGKGYRRLRDPCEELKYNNTDIIGVYHPGDQGMGYGRGGLNGEIVTNQWRRVASLLGADVASWSGPSGIRSLVEGSRCLCVGVASPRAPVRTGPAEVRSPRAATEVGGVRVRSFSPDSKEDVIRKIMFANVHKSMWDVIDLIVVDERLTDAEGKPLKESRARSYYTWMAEYYDKGHPRGAPGKPIKFARRPGSETR